MSSSDIGGGDATLNGLLYALMVINVCDLLLKGANIFDWVKRRCVGPSKDDPSLLCREVLDLLREVQSEVHSLESQTGLRWPQVLGGMFQRRKRQENAEELQFVIEKQQQKRNRKRRSQSSPPSSSSRSS
jgi:hypothetical protein